MSYINWKVEEYEIHQASPTTLPSVDVSLSGIIKNFGAYNSRRPNEVIQEIEHRLNHDDRPRVSYVEYCRKDVEMTADIYNRMSLAIKDVIFHDPATIVFWMDGTKTVVKCQEGDIYDPEKGLAMAISKKALGNKGNYCNEMQKWLPKTEERSEAIVIGKLADIEQKENGIFARFNLNAIIAAETFKKALCDSVGSMSLHFENGKG